MKRILLLSVAAVGLAACAAAPPPEVVSVVPLPEAPQPTEAPPPDVVTVTGAPNPLRAEFGQSKPKSDKQILREANAAAKARMSDGTFTRAKLTYRWVDAEVYPVITAKNSTTSIKLFPGEGLNNSSFGDNRWFGFDPTWSGTQGQKAAPYGPGTVAIPVIAFEAGKCTDLTLYTTWRDILIDICSTSDKRTHNRVVEFWMPEQERKLLMERVAAGEVKPTPMDEATGVPVDRLDTRYSITGPAEWRPKDWRAMNDGKVTYVIPPTGLPFRPVPTIMRNSEADTPSYRSLPQQNGETYYEIDGVPSELRFLNGPDGRNTLTVRRAG